MMPSPNPTMSAASPIGPAPELATPVRISPSRQELRRADPSLSFQVAAADERFFDVIVATDSALFEPAQAHRRTPKNFRSSRQDFESEPIDIETGFYMLPRAFLRDLVSVEPRPSRLYYIAVAYPDATARSGVYSVPGGRLAEAPYVTLAADLSAESLSKVLGMAVERLGTVNTAGRVMASRPLNESDQLPREIGGLPVIHRPAAPLAAGNGGSGRAYGNGLYTAGPQAAAGMDPATGGEWTGLPPESGAPLSSPMPAAAAPGAGGNGKRGNGNGVETIDGNGAGGYSSAGNGMHGAAPSPEPPPPAPRVAATPPATVSDFVDEDFAYGVVDPAPPTGFRDLDANTSGGQQIGYDDGFGPLGNTSTETQASPFEDTASPGVADTKTLPAPIPPLDPAPPVAEPCLSPDAAPSEVPAGSGGAVGDGAPVPQQSGNGSQDDALVAVLIAEGGGGRYDALNLDGAFRGRFGQTHPYYQRAHEGLRLGPHQASQDSGELGELLSLMQSADPASFSQMFGSAAGELVATTTASGPSSLEAEGGRSVRVQPVAGQDLWEEPWVARFRQASEHPAFQAAMRAHIVSRRLEPTRPVAEALGLAGARGTAMLASLAIHMGVADAIAAVRAAINPFDAPAKVAAALNALGHTELSGFQRQHGLNEGEQLDTTTHFMLIAALRELGAESPVQIPDAEAIMDTLVTSVGPGAAGDALLRLRVSDSFRSNGGGG